LEDYARDLALTALDGPELAATLATARTGTTTAGLTDQIATDEHRLTQLVEKFADGEITAEQLSVGTSKLSARISAARERVASANGNRDLLRYAGQGQQLRTTWHTMNLDRRRAVIRAVFDTLTINPATHGARYGFDPDRVAITWRV
jgi:hypothetical protein